MSVYIPDMEMPETCKLCCLSEFDPGFYAYVCKPTGIRIDYDMAKIYRPERICPLVPVPEHGRLVDLDKIENEIAQLSPEDYTTGGIRLILDYAPTIIPADPVEVDNDG